AAPPRPVGATPPRSSTAASRRSATACTRAPSTAGRRAPRWRRCSPTSSGRSSRSTIFAPDRVASGPRKRPARRGFYPPPRRRAVHERAAIAAPGSAGRGVPVARTRTLRARPRPGTQSWVGLLLSLRLAAALVLVGLDEDVDLVRALVVLRVGDLERGR